MEYKLSKGETPAVVVAIQCRQDLWQVRFEARYSRVNRPVLTLPTTATRWLYTW